MIFFRIFQAIIDFWRLFFHVLVQDLLDEKYFFLIENISDIPKYYVVRHLKMWALCCIFSRILRPIADFIWISFDINFALSELWPLSQTGVKWQRNMLLGEGSLTVMTGLPVVTWPLDGSTNTIWMRDAIVLKTTWQDGGARSPTDYWRTEKVIKLLKFNIYTVKSVNTLHKPLKRI